MSEFSKHEKIYNKLSQLDEKVDKFFALINDRPPEKNFDNLMSRRIAALKKLERTQQQIDDLIRIVNALKKGNLLINKELICNFTITPPTLNEYEQNHSLQLEFIIKHLTNIRNNMFKE